jgi:hypothetical protein
MQVEIKGRFNSRNALSQMRQNVLSYFFLCKRKKYEKVKFCLLFYISLKKLSEKEITLVHTLQNKMLKTFP